MTAGGPAGPGGPGTPGAAGGPGRPASGGSSDLIAAGVNGVIALLVVLLAFLPVNTVSVPFYGMEIKGVQNGWGYTNVEATGSLDLKKMMEEELKGYLDEYGGDLFGGSGGDSDYGSSDYGFGSFSSHEFDSRDAVLTDGRDGDSTVGFLPAQDSLGDAFMDGLQQEFENQAGDIEQEIKNQAEAESTLTGSVFFFMLLIVLLFIAAAVLWALRLRLPAAIASIVGAAGLLGYCLMVIVGSQANLAEGIDELKDMDVTYTQSLNAGVWLMILLALAAGAWGLFSLFRWPGALKNGGSSFALPGGFSLPGRQGGRQAGNRFGSADPQAGNRFGSDAPQTGAAGGGRFGSPSPRSDAPSDNRFGSGAPQGGAPSGNRFGSADPQTGNRFGSADHTGQQSDRFPADPGDTAGRADQQSSGFASGSGNHTGPTDSADSQTRGFRSWPGTGSQQSTPEHYRPQDNGPEHNGPEQPGDHRS
ncbi:Yip1 family protein [Corynebacterium frankenforstense]|uniref:Yip1 family protein n=2 Tax=Corynebacterium frankenforstense TaxID=1230998 RepID=UPI00095331C4|nr:Yip1 family protein [Corynebacterium frankenforstense]